MEQVLLSRLEKARIAGKTDNEIRVLVLELEAARAAALSE
jgi:hypothetical protein